jgi:hypothetical protein
MDIQHYLVAFIDLLGQKEQMKGLLLIPPKSDGEERKRYEASIRRPLEAVQFIQSNFQRLVTSSNEWHETEIPGMKPEVAEGLQRYRITDIRIQRFSDGLVLFCPLSKETHFPVGSVWDVLHSCASMMIGGLAEGFAFRAAIAVGAGYAPEQGEIYGPVLAEAYRLESEVAVYPRIVVSGQVATWLASLQRKPHASDEEERVTLAMRDQCQNLVMEDKDGVLVIDFLSAEVLQLLEQQGDAAMTIRRMRDFVDKMIETHRDDPKVLAKYVWIRDYIRSRIKEDKVT